MPWDRWRRWDGTHAIGGPSPIVLKDLRGLEALASFHAKEAYSAPASLAYVRRHSIPLHYGHAFTGAIAVQVDRYWRPIAGTERRFNVDTIHVGYGFLPWLEIPRLLGCALRYDENQGGHVPVPDADFQSNVPGLFVVGDGAGVAGSAVAIEEGRIARIGASARPARPSVVGRWKQRGSSARATTSTSTS